MRVPIPLVILLCLAVVGGVWWHGSRNTDFLTPPSEEKLALVRAKVAASLPPADHMDEPPPPPAPVEPPPPPPVMEEPKPAIELGDLHSPPSLQEYMADAEKGATHLAELAVLLETEGEFQRALLAWERVLDHGKPDEAQTKTAIAAIKRLRPTLPNWNMEPAKAIAITLHAGTGKKTAKILTPLLEQTARELERTSAGILKVTTKITAGKDPKTKTAPAPVALWLAGAAKDSRSTEVMSFTVTSPETLHEDMRKTVFKILCGNPGHKTGQSPPPAAFEGETSMEAMGSHITRLYWQEFGAFLNQPPEKAR